MKVDTKNDNRGAMDAFGLMIAIVSILGIMFIVGSLSMNVFTQSATELGKSGVASGITDYEPSSNTITIEFADANYIEVYQVHNTTRDYEKTVEIDDVSRTATIQVSNKGIYDFELYDENDARIGSLKAQLN